ncbi:hypothetical protein WQQ_15220 [Hydrocarboniphaga effusa AP103]|uniref:Uncharacterized protein n=1 Tax=Hydrocarboniphaga effusa AP103 TaxID=1172194 RepID=I8TBW1_9GAMM|nr:hypothetical protein WQQ_15220 [Hydrocarboniphaga effusa AP103]
MKPQITAQAFELDFALQGASKELRHEAADHKVLVTGVKWFVGLQRSCGMKPQITSTMIVSDEPLPSLLQRSCGMKPQITRASAPVASNARRKLQRSCGMKPQITC